MHADNEFIQQVKATANILDLTEYVVEKDYYVTQVITAVNTVEDECFEAVFQGGTALSKAHGLVQRMSEDCDFRIKKKDGVDFSSKSEHRKSLREFRRKLIQAIVKFNLSISDDETRVLNGGRFMSSRACYESNFSVVAGIKPFVAIDFFLGEIRTPLAEKKVTTLVRNTLGDKIQHSECLTKCLSVSETAAEKWVALTRRVATSTYREHYRDPALVRHVYDLYHIYKSNLLADNFAELAGEIVESDRIQFKNHNLAYHDDPSAEIKRALELLYSGQNWRELWGDFMTTMVYDQEKPDYEQALASLKEISAIALNS